MSKDNCNHPTEMRCALCDVSRNDMDLQSAMMASQKLTEEEVVHDILVQWEGRENLKRLTAFKALVGERDYQDSLNCARLSIGEELVLLSTYLRKAEDNFTTTFEHIQDRRTMEIIRKITAIGLRCMENHGVVERVPLDPKKKYKIAKGSMYGIQDESEQKGSVRRLGGGR